MHHLLQEALSTSSLCISSSTALPSPFHGDVTIFPTVECNLAKGSNLSHSFVLQCETYPGVDTQ